MELLTFIGIEMCDVMSYEMCVNAYYWILLSTIMLNIRFYTVVS